jgi:hypothetical protein
MGLEAAHVAELNRRSCSESNAHSRNLESVENSASDPGSGPNRKSEPSRRERTKQVCKSKILMRNVMKTSSLGRSALSWIILMHITRGVSRSSDMNARSIPLVCKRIRTESALAGDERSGTLASMAVKLLRTPESCTVRTHLPISRIDTHGPLRLKGGHDVLTEDVSVQHVATCESQQNVEQDTTMGIAGFTCIHQSLLDPVHAVQDEKLADTRHFKPGQRFVNNNNKKSSVQTEVFSPPQHPRFTSSPSHTLNQKSSYNNYDQLRQEVLQRADIQQRSPNHASSSGPAAYGSMRVIIPENAQPGQYIEVMIPGMYVCMCMCVYLFEPYIGLMHTWNLS